MAQNQIGTRGTGGSMNFPELTISGKPVSRSYSTVNLNKEGKFVVLDEGKHPREAELIEALRIEAGGTPLGDPEEDEDAE